jgi:hypothetical protein
MKNNTCFVNCFAPYMKAFINEKKSLGFNMLRKTKSSIILIDTAWSIVKGLYSMKHWYKVTFLMMKTMIPFGFLFKPETIALCFLY